MKNLLFFLVFFSCSKSEQKPKDILSEDNGEEATKTKDSDEVLSVTCDTIYVFTNNGTFNNYNFSLRFDYQFNHSKILIVDNQNQSEGFLLHYGNEVVKLHYRRSEMVFPKDLNLRYLQLILKNNALNIDEIKNGWIEYKIFDSTKYKRNQEYQEKQNQMEEEDVFDRKISNVNNLQFVDSLPKIELKNSYIKIQKNLTIDEILEDAAE